MNPVFWDMTSCSLVYKIYTNISEEVSACLRTVLKMDAGSSIETSIHMYQFTRRHVPVDRNHYLQQRDNHRHCTRIFRYSVVKF